MRRIFSLQTRTFIFGIWENHAPPRCGNVSSSMGRRKPADAQLVSVDIVSGGGLSRLLKKISQGYVLYFQSYTAQEPFRESRAYLRKFLTSDCGAAQFFPKDVTPISPWSAA
jgi:hypothetical protein